MLQDNQDYLDKIGLGKQVAAVIDEGVMREESLTKEVELYQRQKPRIDIASVELRPWQKTLLSMIQTPSPRNVRWICGENVLSKLFRDSLWLRESFTPRLVYKHT